MDSILDWIRREGDHLPRRLGLRRQPLAPALLEGAALEGRLRLRPGQLHARRRRVAPGRSSRAARRGARPRWSCSTSTTRTSRSSSGARRARRRRRACSRRPATTCRSTRPTGPRSSTRTPTTRSASPTRSWRRPSQDADWNLTARTDGAVVETIKARELLRQIAEAAWKCADPGVQYDTTINEWHTLPNTGRINASNPCSEYMSIDDSRLQPRLAEPDEVPPRGRRARRRGASSTRSTSSSSRRRSSSATRRTRRPRSSGTRRRTASSASATRTSARC